MDAGPAIIGGSAPGSNRNLPAIDPVALQLDGDRHFERQEFAAAEEIFRGLLESGYTANWCYFQWSRVTPPLCATSASGKRPRWRGISPTGRPTETR